MDTSKKLMKIILHLTLVPPNESKQTMKKSEKLWSKIRDSINSITKSSDDYDENYVKITFNLNGNLPLENARTS